MFSLTSPMATRFRSLTWYPSAWQYFLTILFLPSWMVSSMSFGLIFRSFACTRLPSMVMPFLVLAMASLVSGLSRAAW